MDINDALKCADDPESNSVVETTLAAVVRRLSAELERLREQKAFGYMSAENKDSHPDGVYVKREPWKTQTNIPLYAAPVPAAVLELIAEVDRLRDEVNGMTGTIARIETERNNQILRNHNLEIELRECRSIISRLAQDGQDAVEM